MSIQVRPCGTAVTLLRSLGVPRYYFDFRDGDHTIRDADGIELADLEEARAQALAALGGVARDELPDGDDRQFEVVVRDEEGPRLTASLVLHVDREQPKSASSRSRES